MCLRRKKKGLAPRVQILDLSLIDDVSKGNKCA